MVEFKIAFFYFEEDPCAKNAQSLASMFHEVFYLIIFYRLNLRLRV